MSPRVTSLSVPAQRLDDVHPIKIDKHGHVIALAAPRVVTVR